MSAVTLPLRLIQPQALIIRFAPIQVFEFVTIRVYDIMIPSIHHRHHFFLLKSILSSYLASLIVCTYACFIGYHSLFWIMDFFCGIIIFSGWIII
jgi:hypothetical protein